MLLRRVPSRIELVVAPRFDLGDGGAGAVMMSRTGDGGIMNALGIKLLKSSRRLEMSVSCSWWMVAGAYLTAH